MPSEYCRVFRIAWLLPVLPVLLVPTAVRGHAAAGNGNGAAPVVVIEHRLAHYVVETSGAYRLTVDDVRTIAGPRAVQDGGQYTIAYDKSLEDIVALAACTQKPHGPCVPVASSQVRDRREAMDGMHLKIVEFDGLAIGDRIVLRYAIRRHAPRRAGQFEDVVTAPRHPVRDLQVVYDMPAGMPLHADAVGFAAVPSPHPAGRLRYRWRHVTGAPVDGAAAGWLAVSTFAGQPVLAAMDDAGLRRTHRSLDASTPRHPTACSSATASSVNSKRRSTRSRPER